MGWGVRFAIGLVLILALAVVAAMTGRGGGNFYVPLMVACGAPMHQAAASGQLILVATASAAALLFHKRRTVDWKLALAIDPPTDVMALVGGYLSAYVAGTGLKLLMAGLLVAAGLCMFLKPKERSGPQPRRFGFWRRKSGGEEYTVNLWLALPVAAATGLVAGAVGVSGGSFKVPLMVLACGVPMRVAVGTSSVMVAATAAMGLAGHAAQGHFDPRGALLLALVAALGGFVGSRFALKTKPKNLKVLFALTSLAAAAFMALNAFLSR
jgi:uncharacterized membrane protein YfcA